MTKPIAELRQDYTLASLAENDVAKDPLQQFTGWLEQARETQVNEPTAMTVATVDEDNNPTARIVLLKDYDTDGLVFYSNYLSAKGQHLSRYPRAALLFFWPELQRQVRIEGTVTRVSQEQSRNYFHSRPRDSQIGALASYQSQVVANRQILQRRFEELQQRYNDDIVPLPPNWGGYRVKAQCYEFWQGRTSRMHDRLLYLWDEQQAEWLLQRLEP